MKGRKIFIVSPSDHPLAVVRSEVFAGVRHASREAFGVERKDEPGHATRRHYAHARILRAFSRPADIAGAAVGHSRLRAGALWESGTTADRKGGRSRWRNCPVPTRGSPRKELHRKCP